jgi:hypothetical protein
MHADIAGPAEVMNDRTVQNLEPARPRRLADDNLGDVMRMCVVDHVVGNASVAGRQRNRFAAERLGEPQRIGDAVAFLFGELHGTAAFYVQSRPRAVEPVGEPLGVAHQPGTARISTIRSPAAHGPCYLDVEELMSHGIDVYTTVNIQHIESLNDVVAQITHVRLRETVPDAVFDRADAVELVDRPCGQTHWSA